MNWTIIIIETAILVLIFTAAIMIPLIKNPVWWIHDYPKDIQERIHSCRLWQFHTVCGWS